jgi:hypothetical protein
VAMVAMHDKANKEILAREYREGFAPPAVS